MSVDNSVFLCRHALPSPADWQRAIAAAGFPLAVDADFDFEAFEGFLPCRLDGDECGFEIYAGGVDLGEFEADGSLSAEQRKALGPREFLVTLSTRSSFRDGLASVFAAAALCDLCDGMLSCSGGPFISGPNALSWARQVEPSMREGLSAQLEKEKRRRRVRE